MTSSHLSTNAIAVVGLAKRYGAVRALEGLDLTVPRGSSFGFIGPNGAGKTTLLKILLSLVHPSAGRVQVLDGDPADPAIRRRIGYLPERLQLAPMLRAVDVLRSAGRLKGLSAGQLEREVPHLLDQVGLERSAWKRRVGTFSKGMVQRTGLAIALLGQPELLLLDEPTDGVDPLGRARIREVLREALARGATLFLNSHLLSETEKLCDHVAIAHRGRVVRSGPMHLLRDEHCVAVRFSATSDLVVRASQAGFRADPAQANGTLFLLDGNDPAMLSAALARAIGLGLQVVEVTPRVRDLEQVLAEFVQEDA
ncbi:MAG: ABC transporter ATP-binding protein [Pseudomonadota bacterium]